MSTATNTVNTRKTSAELRRATGGCRPPKSETTTRSAEVTVVHEDGSVEVGIFRVTGTKESVHAGICENDR